MIKISAYIIAYNEIEKITDCINSVLWADEIIVIDSHSTDGTTAIAEKMGCKIIHVPFKGFGQLRNEAIKHCTGEWILSLDSDERCTTEFRDEVMHIIKNSNYDIYKVPRKNYFMGRWIRHSGWYPNFRQPQLFRNGKMSYTMDPVHEGYVKNSGKDIQTTKSFIWQFPFKNTEEIMHKANRYSTLGARKLNSKGTVGSVTKAIYHGLWAFIKHYIFKFGFLDGGAGFVIAFGNFEGTFYRYLKLSEIQFKWESAPITEPIKKID